MTSRHFRTSALMAMLVAASNLSAQGTSAQLSGTVAAKSGEKLAGATVVIRNAETGLIRNVQTDGSGRFIATSLPVGPYTVTVTKAGFQSASNIKINLNLGDAAPLSVKLGVEAGTTVEVVSSVSAVDNDRAAAATYISPEAIETLPINGRRWEDYAFLTPQVTRSSRGDIAIGGQRGVNTAINVDGGNYNSSFFGGTLGSEANGTPFTLSSEAIREFQVVTDGASAEFGGNGGGYLNAITKSGTNAFTGGVFFYERPQNLVATRHSNGQEVTDFTNRQFGASVGGPIIMDKLFYFVSVDIQRDSRPNTVAFGPSASAPITLDPAVGGDAALLANDDSYTITNNQEAIFARLDWLLNANHTIQFRLNRSSFTGDNGAGFNVASSATSLEEGKTLSLVGQWNWNISPNWLNEFRLNSVTEELPRTPRGTKPQVDIRNVGRYGQALFGRQFESKQFQISDILTYVTPEWQFRGGLQVINYDIFETFIPRAGGVYFFSSIENYRAGNWADYQQFFSLQPGVSVEQAGTMDEKAKDLGAFLQADWRPNQAWKVGFGLRYDRQEHPGFGIADFNQSNFSTFTRPGPLTAKIPTDTAISPRFSFTWSPEFDQGHTVVRGSAGLYVSRTPSVFNYQVLTSNGQRAALVKFTSVTGMATVYPSFTRGATFNYNDPFHFTSYDAVNFPASAAPSIQSFDPSFQNPRTRRFNVGAERFMGKGLTLGISATYAKTFGLERITDVNLLLQGYNSVGRPIYGNNKGLDLAASYPTNNPLRLVRPNTNYDSMQLYTSDAKASYKAVTLSAKYAPDDSFIEAQLFYTYAQDKDMDSNERSFSGYNTQDPNHLASDYSWSANDRRNVITGYVNFHERWFSGVNFGFNVRYLSGSPYNPTFSTDRSADGTRNDRIWGTARNSYREPGRYIVDLKIGRDWKFAQRFKVGVSADIFNLFNKTTRYTRTNSFGGTDLAPTASTPTFTISTERQVQMGVRFTF